MEVEKEKSSVGHSRGSKELSGGGAKRNGWTEGGK